MNVGVYATWEEIKNYLTGIRKDDYLDDRNIKHFAVNASRLFDAWTYRHFYPLREARYFNAPLTGEINRAYNPGFAPAWGDYPLDSGASIVRERRGETSVLWLYDDLLEVVSLTTKNGTVTISASDYLLLNGSRYNRTPYNKIRLQPNGTTTEFGYVNTPFKANAVDGLWGYHDDWGNAWLDTGATIQNNPLAAAATAVTLSSSSVADNFGDLALKEQSLLRFGANNNGEMAYLVNRGTDTMTVVRGVNGSTAAEQAQGTAIYVYQPMADIGQIMLTWATYLFKLKQSPFGIGGTAELGQRTIANLLGSDMAKLAETYRDETRRRG